MTRLSPAVLVVLLSCASAAFAQQLTMTAALQWSQVYRSDSWQPVLLELRNESDRAIEGTAVLPLSDAQSPALMKVPVTVPPRGRARVTLWGYFPARQPEAAKRKPDQIPPLSIAEWRGRDSALLARTELTGIPVAAKSADAGSGDAGEMVLLVNQRGDVAGESYDVEALMAHLSDAAGVPVTVAAIDANAFPRQPGGLRSLKAIVLEGFDPETLDLAQRDELLAYLRGGGVVVVSAPTHAWSLLPVRLVGTRLARQVEMEPEGAALKLRAPLTIVEAVEGEGQVLLRDRAYVHLAVRSVGLGKVIFTSFPINGPDESQPQVAALWEQLLSLKQRQPDVKDSQLAAQRHQILGSMIGRKVAPWWVAAALAGGYVVMIVLAQALFGGAARPKAFVVSVAGALVLSTTLLAMGMMRRSENVLQSARLAVIDVAPDGGGWAHESVAYIGTDDPTMAIEATDERVMIRPAAAEARNPPAIRQQPFAVENGGVYAERVERAWEQTMPLAAESRFNASVRFGEKGPTLEIDNGLHHPLAAPILVSNRRGLSINDLAEGKSTVESFRANDRDDFSSGSAMLTSDLAKRRSQVIKALLTPANQTMLTSSPELPPMLIGWIAQQPGDRLIRPSQREVVDEKAMVMVRAPVRLEAAVVGTKISVPPALVRFNSGQLPYDRDSAESVPSREQGEWLIGFAIAPQVGIINPIRVTLEARVTLPSHAMTVRKGQVSQGRAKENLDGEPVAEWKREVGLRKVTIECSPGDYDSAGRVWLLLEVRPEGAAMATSPWQIKDVSMSFDQAEVTGPPKPIALDIAPATSGKKQQQD